MVSFCFSAESCYDIGRNRGGSSKALHLIQAKTLIIGIESDILFWPEEQTFLNTNIPDSNLEMIQSLYGHDGFLLENEKISAAIAAFLKLN